MIRKTILLSFVLIFFSATCEAKTYSKKKLERFFDLNDDRVLSYLERALIKTQIRYSWPLANSKRKKLYDYNADFMLEPFEEALYKRRADPKEILKTQTILRKY